MVRIVRSVGSVRIGGSGGKMNVELSTSNEGEEETDERRMMGFDHC